MMMIIMKRKYATASHDRPHSPGPRRLYHARAADGGLDSDAREGQEP